MESPPAPPPPAPSSAHPPRPPPPESSCWTTIVKKKPPAAIPLSNNIFSDFCKSSNNISVAVVDASAIIHGEKLSGCADKFLSVREVVDEVRDPISRRRLAQLPFVVEIIEPSLDAIKKVVKFARETGDLQTLSDVDVKLIALTYMLEAQIHGTNHLRDSPPMFHVVNLKNLPESKMPGWGDNVPNLAEWEALEQVTEEGLMGDSQLHPLKDLDDNVIKTNEAAAQPTEQQYEHQIVFRPKKYNFPKREIKIEGKKMVADGVDASNGEDVNNSDDWQPAVSRSTHRKYLRRKARRESRTETKVSEHPVVEATTTTCTNRGGDDVILENSQGSNDTANHEVSKNAHIEDEPSKNDELENSNFVEDIACSAFEQMSIGNDNSEVPQEEENHVFSVKDDHSLIDEDCLDDFHIVVENENDICENLSENLEVSSNADGNMNTSFFDDASSEQSWKMRSLSDSTVACITSDFAMQNVILQIGLRLLAPGGMQIRQLHRWVLKCHACNNVTREIGKIFCPKCGNGGTLRKVSVTVGENGVSLASRRQRFILRGTKFSLPLPQGGRDAITKNLILREDQLPHKLLYPKMKKPNKKDEDFLCSDDIFSNVSEKRSPLKPPVRKALALFGGKRNPNDNHFSRKH